jgi:hypothetical protein
LNVHFSTQLQHILQLASKYGMTSCGDLGKLTFRSWVEEYLEGQANQLVAMFSDTILEAICSDGFAGNSR